MNPEGARGPRQGAEDGGRRCRIGGKEILIMRGVYPPSEDTYLLIDALEGRYAERALELCSGTGAVGLSAVERLGSIVAVDISPAASLNTLANYRINGASSKVQAVTGDLFSPLRKERAFDLIFMNPPYLIDEGEGDPARDLSWSGGPGGRREIDRFIGGVGDYLTEGGTALLLQSSLNGTDESLEMIRAEGFPCRVARSSAFQFEELVVIEIGSPSPSERLKY